MRIYTYTHILDEVNIGSFYNRYMYIIEFRFLIVFLWRVGISVPLFSFVFFVCLFGLSLLFLCLCYYCYFLFSCAVLLSFLIWCSFQACSGRQSISQTLQTAWKAKGFHYRQASDRFLRRFDGFHIRSCSRQKMLS